MTITPALNGSVEEIALTRQRITATVDPLGVSDVSLSATLQPFRVEAITRVYAGISKIQGTLTQLNSLLNQPPLPTMLTGMLTEPGGEPAGPLQVQFNPASIGGRGQPVTTLTSATDGGFTLAVPAGLTLPATGLPLTIHGADGNKTITVPSAQVAANGLLGVIALPAFITPLPVSILQALANLYPAGQPSSPNGTGAPASPALPAVRLGEEGSVCAVSIGANASVDTFPYGVFFRLVEPRLSIVQEAQRFTVEKANGYLPLPVYSTQASVKSAESTIYVDRLPVEQPLSADGFRDQVAGLAPDGYFTADEQVAMAATLGLGYVLWMSQQWTFTGVGLGDLVYSLPLAPGEQQEIAVFERQDTSSVSESEFLSEDQVLQERALADTSTNATFNSAFNEMAAGGSTFQTNSTTASGGVNLVIAAGGAGSSSTNGTDSSWLSGQRNTVENAAQQTHSAAENQASARRTASRTAMRLASASESESVTTKTITNHNHAHALTMQYWQVQRLYDVTTGIDGATLACLVPMQMVRFIRAGQPLVITDPSQLSTSGQVLARYSSIIRHLDVLSQAVPRRYQHGLTLLEQFAANPTSTVEPYGGTAEDVIQFELTGTFTASEEIWIAAVTDRGTRVGPAHLENSLSLPLDTYATQDSLLAAMQNTRQNLSKATTLTGALALPPSMSRNNIVGFEITRAFRPLRYALVSAAVAELQALQGLFGSTGASWITQAIESTVGSDPAAAASSTVQLSPGDLESALGGPHLVSFHAWINDMTGGGTGQAAQVETYANDPLFGVELPTQPYPVPALQVAPVLKFGQILEIEAMAQHVVRNTTQYSQAIWASLSAGERAILLDQYTIGVSPGGITDESEMVPLLNCVQNKLLGFFGNSMILPFIIPQGVAEQLHLEDPSAITDALVAYQQSSFTPPHSTIALPTDGVLGEAVLGHCASAEKVDLLRFWNWQDSASDSAPAIAPVTLPTTTPSISGGLTAPNTLGALPSLINNVLTAPAPEAGLAQSLGTAAASQADFSTSLTGAAQLAALATNAQNVSNSARADALAQSTKLHAQAMATVGNILGAIYAGNPTAGSTAAAAVNGQGGGSTSGTGTGTGSGTGATGKTGSTGTTGTGKTGTGTGGTGTGGTGTGGTGTGGTGTGTGAGGTGTGTGGTGSGGTGTGTGSGGTGTGTGTGGTGTGSGTGTGTGGTGTGGTGTGTGTGTGAAGSTGGGD